MFLRANGGGKMTTAKRTQTDLGDFIDSFLKRENISLAELGRRMARVSTESTSLSNLHRAYRGNIKTPGEGFYVALAQVTGTDFSKLRTINSDIKYYHDGRQLSSRAVILATQADELDDELFHDLVSIATLFREKQKSKGK